MRRSPTLAMVGGRCIVINFVGEGVELFSSEVVFSSVKEVGWKGGAVCQAFRSPKGIEPLVEGVLERG